MARAPMADVARQSAGNVARHAALRDELHRIALLACGALPLVAAGWGVWLHGAAGRAAAQQVGSIGFLARDLPQHLPSLMTL